MGVFSACIVGYRITFPFRLQVVKHFDQLVQDVHIEAQLLGLSYLKQCLGFLSITFTCMHFLCSYVSGGDEEYPFWIDPSWRDPTEQQSRLATGRETH